LTLARAKPVVPLLNRPFLAYQLALLRGHGVTDVILACSYRVDDVRMALGNGSGLGVHLRYAVEEVPRGTGGGVRNAADLERGSVFALNGDVLTDADIGAMHRFHVDRRAQVTIMLVRVPDPRPFGLVECADNGRIRAFREKPSADEDITTDTINGGVYIIDAPVVARIPRDRPVSIEREVFPQLVANGVACYGWIAEPYWRDIGTPETYRAAQLDLLDGKVRSSLGPPGAPSGGSWVGDRVHIERGARVEAPSVLGPGAYVEAGARIGPRTVLGAGCRIGAGAGVAGSVLWEDVSVGAGAVLDGCVVANAAQVGARAEIGPGATVAAGAIVPGGTRLPRSPVTLS
jgi:mannose-1-phosphate guanylyltransferase